MRFINEIITHCSATPATWRADQTPEKRWAEVRRWHVVENGWSDWGYHFGIDRDGTILIGRPLERAGAHVKGRNRHSIGIMMFGGKGGTDNDEFLDNFTPEQEEALRKLIAKLREKFPTITTVSGHNQYAAKACPTFNVPRWYEGEGKRKLSQSRTMRGAGAVAVGQGGQELTDAISKAQDQISPFVQYSDYIQYAFVALSILGVLAVIYARWDDYHNKGHTG